MTINRLQSVAVLLILAVLRTERSAACNSTPSPVDCVVSGWGSWGDCSKTCELGSQVRKRYATTNQAHGGRNCPSLTESRSCREAECPIDCQWGEWGGWTNCSSYGTKSRFRNITTPAMFGGWECTGINVEVAAGCLPPEIKDVKCEQDQLLCRDEITCVRDTLTCNGDDDCTDYSDELHCDAIYSPCSSPKDRIPSVDVVGAAFDILRNDETGTILDNWRYDGRCSIVTSGDHGRDFRKPANILSYRFQAKAESSFSMKSYECARTFMQEEREEQQYRMEVGFSFIFLSAKVAYSNDHKRTSIIENGSKTNSKFFKTQSRIEVAQFRTLRHDLFTTYSFRQRESELPEHFDYAEYSKIITDFGTHYYSSGVLGGEFETIYRFDRSELEESRLSEDQQKQCIETEIGASTSSGAGGGVETSICSTNTLSQRYGGSFVAAAKEVVSTVRGGSSDTAASLTFSHQETPSKEDFDAWAETIKDNPAVVDYMLAPISAVFTSDVKKANMEQALYEYMIRFNPDVCPPECLNEGEPVVVNDGKECKCLCSINYSGPACRDAN